MFTIKSSICAIIPLVTVSIVAPAAANTLTIMPASMDQQIDLVESVSAVAVSFDSVFLDSQSSTTPTGWQSDAGIDAVDYTAIDLDLGFTTHGIQSSMGNPVLSSLSDVVRSGELPERASTMPMNLSLRFDH